MPRRPPCHPRRATEQQHANKDTKGPAANHPTDRITAKKPPASWSVISFGPSCHALAPSRLHMPLLPAPGNVTQSTWDASAHSGLVHWPPPSAGKEDEGNPEQEFSKGTAPCTCTGMPAMPCHGMPCHGVLCQAKQSQQCRLSKVKQQRKKRHGTRETHSEAAMKHPLLPPCYANVMSSTKKKDTA
ncbi:hypothetical protein ACJBU6_07909 [Exserohilum turcicum]